MSNLRPFWLLIVLGAFVCLTLMPGPEPSRAQQQRFEPKLEAVAETKLLMEGLAKANFQGLDRLLREQPTKLETWKFIRGQSLLVAETGNLLMLRPPKTEPARTVWFQKATELRKAGLAVATSASQKDFNTTRVNFVKLANACNSCHKSFSVRVQVTPFGKL
ncbi:MAG: hypothetical protein ACFCD0_28875 [Gemmataceae bacterium]